MRDSTPPERADALRFDVVPILGFQALDFIERGLNETLTTWQKRIVLDLYGAGPEPVKPEA